MPYPAYVLCTTCYLLTLCHFTSTQAVRRAPLQLPLWQKLAALQPTLNQRTSVLTRALRAVCAAAAEGHCSSAAVLHTSLCLLSALCDARQQPAAEEAAARLLSADDQGATRTLVLLAHTALRSIQSAVRSTQYAMNTTHDVSCVACRLLLIASFAAAACQVPYATHNMPRTIRQAPLATQVTFATHHVPLHHAPLPSHRCHR